MIHYNEGMQNTHNTLELDADELQHQNTIQDATPVS